jgi:hypothetical protein
VTEPFVIFETVHGSTAYGLAREGSDIEADGERCVRTHALGPTTEASQGRSV